MKSRIIIEWERCADLNTAMGLENQLHGTVRIAMRSFVQELPRPERPDVFTRIEREEISVVQRPTEPLL